MRPRWTGRMMFTPLQRSHDLSAVETVHAPALDGDDDVHPASTEPRPLGRGNPLEERLPAPAIGASTEPRPLGRGNDGSFTVKPKVVLLQRSHDLSAVETP